MSSFAKLFSLFALVAVFSSARAEALFTKPGPQIEPGPVLQVGSDGLNAANILLKIAKAEPTKMQQFVDAGNTITTFTYQHQAPDVTNYVVVTQTCFDGGVMGGHCMGGASLDATITVERDSTGEVVHETVKADVTSYR